MPSWTVIVGVEFDMLESLNGFNDLWSTKNVLACLFWPQQGRIMNRGESKEITYIEE